MKKVSRAALTALAVVAMLAAGLATASAQDQIPTEKGPILVVETTKGTFEIKTYPAEAPKTVAHVIALAKQGFYNGLRFHRVVPGFVIQVGDPQSRDMSKRALWGTGGSGHPIGVAEISKKLTHIKGAVAMAHAGDPAKADSQFYVTLAPQHPLDGKYAVFGQVISGEDVPARIQVGDIIKKMTVKPGTE
ncbi:MAG TPA: peptidylprolyl isomerase [Vicinamibacterales bacterium]|jgi:peptidyl-prolyl cis-trans isomerase B (cyclophilin B)